MQFLPDPFKLEVFKFLDSAAGKALLTTLRANQPANPDANLPHSTKLSTYDQRAGYEKALDMLVKIPHGSQQDNSKPTQLSPLIDPRD